MQIRNGGVLVGKLYGGITKNSLTVDGWVYIPDRWRIAKHEAALGLE
ncbi:hypothetical protein [Nitrosomonas ureae]|nr:hypothetical protein [Nitrosomonas ureae]